MPLSGAARASARRPSSIDVSPGGTAGMLIRSFTAYEPLLQPQCENGPPKGTCLVFTRGFTLPLVGLARGRLTCGRADRGSRQAALPGVATPQACLLVLLQAGLDDEEQHPCHDDEIDRNSEKIAPKMSRPLTSSARQV